MLILDKNKNVKLYVRKIKFININLLRFYIRCRVYFLEVGNSYL